MIRDVRPDELARLRDIEREAGRRFVDIGMDDIAEDEPLSVDVLEGYRRDGRAWVADVDGEAVGYVLADVVDDAAHVEQLSVLPAHGGSGLGRALLDQVGRWAQDRAITAMTLTTFASVPWNAPYYERCGFRRLADDERGPELVALCALEAAHGLDPATRVCMRRELTSD